MGKNRFPDRRGARAADEKPVGALPQPPLPSHPFPPSAMEGTLLKKTKNGVWHPRQFKLEGAFEQDRLMLADV